MKLIADLHIHSKYSGGTSKYLSIDTIALWARRKGVNLISTGDITHPLHLQAIEKKLSPCPYGNDGFYIQKDVTPDNPLRFMLTGEVSNIYRQNGQMKKVHNLIFAPNIETVKKLNSTLDRYGNLHADGRPIFGFSCEDLVKIVLNISEDCLIVPAHSWTPWYGLFGSRGGFNSLEECFGDYSKYIYAIETGLDSTPEMNRRVSGLDNITMLANSDAHSPSKIGREASVFKTADLQSGETGYKDIVDIIKTGDKDRFLHTIEFFPEIGKYYNDGHRNCKINLTPKETNELNGICPKCNKEITVGVLSRIEELSDRPSDYPYNEGSPNYIPTKLIAPLEEIISSALGVGVKSNAVQKEYMRLVDLGGSEFNVLLDANIDEMLKITAPIIVEGIKKVRSGDIKITPGFDGEFGLINLFKKQRKKKQAEQEQMSLL